jgi:flagellar hook protein FlgE
MAVSPLTIATSALLAQEAKVSVIADNIAKFDTANFRPQQASLVSINPGVKVGAILTADRPDVDLASEFVNLILARTAYEASLKVVGASDDMASALLKTI